jgi:undecaprenyl-diphosphatase
VTSNPEVRKPSGENMDFVTGAEALILGVIEGLTEYIPVSSTGHLLLASHFLGFESKGKVFEIVIQLGAIFAIVSVYFARLWQMLIDFPKDARTRKFIYGLLIAFLPAAALGVLGHSFIKGVLFESPMLICVTLIIGGVILLGIDRMNLKPRHSNMMDFPLPLCLGIGLFQCLALIPGTSRSGATIVGALLLGADRRSAAEFSFFLAMPTLGGAFVYDLYKNRDNLTFDEAGLIALGFAAAFVTAVIVVRYMLEYVSRSGFALFAWWRIIVGAAGLAALAAGF